MIQFIRHLQNAMRFMQLPENQRRLVFYSEGKNYWVHLQALLRVVMEKSDIPVCYISSGEDDPGLSLEHPQYKSFKIDEGWVRNWLFENIETEIMVMTMPDINQFQVKRSKHKVHYVYVQHSLVSLHMIYRNGAFDNYDTIFCAGPHHVKEMQAIVEKHNLLPKNLVEHGYGRLDAIIEEAKQRSHKYTEAGVPKHVLLAPSWGAEGTIESGVAEKMVELLITQGFQITLRPHPQTIKFSSDKIESILNRYRDHPLFNYEANVAGQDSLHDSDIMISDWSGAALEYAFGLAKPVIFIDVPRKINNPVYQETQEEPFEVLIRNEIGAVIKINELSDLPLKITALLNNDSEINYMDLVNKHVFNVGKSAECGAEQLLGLLDSRS